MNASGEDPPPREANALLRRARELRGWSRERLVSELQQRFPGVAVTPKDVARWERGKRRPGPYYREKLCAIFEMTADQLGLIAPMPVPALGPAPPPALAPPPAPAGSLTSVPLLTISLVRSEVESGDPAIWLGIRLAQIIYRIGTWRGHALDCEEVQTLIDQELAMIDETLQSSTTQQALQL
jgi:transcriptional regulator with XRE-family HTH domain